ncbi:MAG: amidohydrolase family protein [Janthinobacterium lividum]
MEVVADLMIENAKVMVTMDDQRRELAGGWVAITNGLITDIGGPDHTKPQAVRRLDASGCIVTPGFINTHHHMFQNLTRSNPQSHEGDFFYWLRTLYPMFARVDEEAVYVSAWVGLAELALGGTTTTSDMLYVHPKPFLIDAEIRAAQELGFRFHPTRGVMNLSEKDGGLPPESVVQDDETIIADCERLIAKYHDRSHGAMVRIALGPAAIFTVTPQLLQRLADLSEKHDVGFHMHLAESHLENEFCQEHFGCHPIDNFERLGLASDRAWGAHVMYARDEDMAKLAKWGVGVAHCPSTVFMMGGRHGTVTPVREMRDAGVKVGLGCDGSSSSDSASLWLEARTMLGLQRLRSGGKRMGGMDDREAIEIATRGGAAILRRTGELGELSVGAVGDVVCWPVDGPSYAGAVGDPVRALFMSGPNAPRHTVIAGKALVENGRFTAPGMRQMLERHQRIARRIQGYESPEPQ